VLHQVYNSQDKAHNSQDNMSEGLKHHVYEVLGIIGGILLSICVLPQLWYMYRTKDASSLQKRFLLLILVGDSLTLLYLIEKDAWAAWVNLVIEV
jgi:hypothetical protein